MGDISADEAIADLNKRYNEALENDIKIGKTKRIVIKDFDPLHPGEGTVEYTE
jgi:multiple sugar transport system substrate-binding protein